MSVNEFIKRYNTRYSRGDLAIAQHLASYVNEKRNTVDFMVLHDPEDDTYWHVEVEIIGTLKPIEVSEEGELIYKQELYHRCMEAYVVYPHEGTVYSNIPTQHEVKEMN